MAIGQWQSGRLWLCSRGRKMSGGHLLCADRSGAETDSPWSPHGWVCLVARAADCKSVTQKHRRFESCPIHFTFACPSGLWCHPAKVVCGNAPKVQILPQTILIIIERGCRFNFEPLQPLLLPNYIHQIFQAALAELLLFQPYYFLLLVHNAN